VAAGDPGARKRAALEQFEAIQADLNGKRA
jgi:hypothetical protein